MVRLQTWQVRRFEIFESALSKLRRSLVDPDLHLDSGSRFRFRHHCGIGDLGRVLTFSHSHPPVFFTKLGEMTDADKVTFWEHPGRHPDQD